MYDETENTQSSQENTHQHIYNDDTVHNERAPQDIRDDNQDEVSQNSQSRQNEDNNTDHNCYPVEKLLKTRVRSGIREFLIRWEGNYPDSWEPVQNMSDHLKNEFYTRKSNKKKKR